MLVATWRPLEDRVPLEEGVILSVPFPWAFCVGSTKAQNEAPHLGRGWGAPCGVPSMGSQGWAFVFMGLCCHFPGASCPPPPEFCHSLWTFLRGSFWSGAPPALGFPCVCALLKEHGCLHGAGSAPNISFSGTGLWPFIPRALPGCQSRTARGSAHYITTHRVCQVKA